MKRFLLVAAVSFAITLSLLLPPSLAEDAQERAPQSPHPCYIVQGHCLTT